MTWALGTNSDLQIQGALTNLNSLLVDTDTNLNALTESIGVTLVNVAGITSNLNAQVQANQHPLGNLEDGDGHGRFRAGSKRHWLLRSAFKTKATNAPPKSPAKK